MKFSMLSLKLAFTSTIKLEAMPVYFTKPDQNSLVTVPIHSKDIPQGTLRRILKQADLTTEEFLRLV
jgi:hypothetical protein